MTWCLHRSRRLLHGIQHVAGLDLAADFVDVVSYEDYPVGCWANFTVFFSVDVSVSVLV